MLQQSTLHFGSRSV